MKLKPKNQNPQVEKATTKVNPMKVAEKRKSLVDTFTEDLEDKGVIFFKPTEQGGTLNIDNEYLMLPKDLTEIPSRLLGNYLNAFTQQRMYYRTLLGWLQSTVEESKREYYDISTPMYEELSKQKLSETAKERILNNLDEVKPSFIKYKDEKKKLLLLNYSLASIEDAIFLISREVSRRTGDFNSENRNDNIQRR